MKFSGMFDEDGNCHMTLPEEEWRAVPGWENEYAVSNYGEVYSLPRVVTRGSRWGGVKTDQIAGGILEASQGLGDKYKVVTLRRPGVKKDARVHCLVASAFIGPRPEGMDVCHNDGVRSHNWLDNLRYGTRKENCEDTKKHGTALTGEARHNAIYSNEQVRQIKSMLDRKSNREIRNETGVDIKTVGSIRRGERWGQIV